MALKHHFNTSGWHTLAKERPADLIRMLDDEYDLVRQVATQRRKLTTSGISSSPVLAGE